MQKECVIIHGAGRQLMFYFSAIRYFLVFFWQSDNTVMDYGIGKKGGE